MKITKVNKVEGDASVNVRKGRIRQVFDISMELDLEYDVDFFTAKITDWMSDTDFGGFEFYVQGTILNKEQKDSLKREIWNVLMEFKSEVEEVQGKPLLVQSSNSSSAETATTSSNETKTKFNGILPEDHTTKSKNDQFDSFKETQTITTSVQSVWKALTEKDLIMGWSRNTASLNGNIQVGEAFTLLNGGIVCKVTAMEPLKSLKMDWKLRHWENSSSVELNFIDKNGFCELRFEQRNIPKADLENVMSNWQQYYWKPLKIVLGCDSIPY